MNTDIINFDKYELREPNVKSYSELKRPNNFIVNSDLTVRANIGIMMKEILKEPIPNEYFAYDIKPLGILFNTINNRWEETMINEQKIESYFISVYNLCLRIDFDSVNSKNYEYNEKKKNEYINEILKMLKNNKEIVKGGGNNNTNYMPLFTYMVFILMFILFIVVIICVITSSYNTNKYNINPIIDG